MTKKSFILYHDTYEHIKLLSTIDKGLLLDAIFRHSMGEDVNLDGMTLMAFSFIKTQMSRDYEKWNDIRDKRVLAGIKSGEARRVNADEQKGTSVRCVEQKPTKRTVSVTDTVTVTVNDTVSGSSRKESATNKVLTKEIIIADYSLYVKYAVDKWGWTPTQVENEIKEFLAYWTYGEGAGKKRKSWLLTWQKKVRANYGNINNKGE